MNGRIEGMQAGGRGGLLPPEETDLLVDALPVSPDPADLRRACGSAARLLFGEARHADAELASRLSSPIEELTRFGAGPP